MSKVRFGLDLLERRTAYEKVLRLHGDRLKDPGHLDRVVHRKLAREALWRASRAYDRRRTDVVPVAELVAFAQDCWPDFERLPEYRGLRLRQRIGPGAMPWLQPFVLSAVVNKGREWMWRQSWERRGL